MNTVESLKKLYKTMAGKDWPYDPNPTDAEVIKAIAKDASTGGGSGSGSGGGRVIDLTELEHHQEAGNGGTIHVYSGYEAGLSAADFANVWVVSANCLYPITVIENNLPPSNTISLTYGTDRDPDLTYNPDTGGFAYLTENGGK